MHYPAKTQRMKRQLRFAGIGIAITLSVSGIWASQNSLAKPKKLVDSQASPMHPTFPLLDTEGDNVLETQKSVSTLKTCGACHDTTFIQRHSFHADVGLSEISSPGSLAGSYPWETSPGMFGKWNPLAYRYLSPEGDERPDLSTASWVMYYGARHVGGGPAMYSQSGEPLTSLQGEIGSLETSIVDPETGSWIAWDWRVSGVVEMNCFACHTPNPNHTARNQELQAGRFGWANSATLSGSGIIEPAAGGYRWIPEAFEPDGELKAEAIQIQDPTNENCGACHGLVHDDIEDPLVLADCSPERWRTVTTGQIVSPQRMSDSGMNLSGKEELSRSWDVHAESLVQCTDCHFSLNNPIYYQESQESRPAHLSFDPRRLEIGEYLYQPLHQFARGQSAQGSIAPELRATMRTCESCHSIERTHDWLPYKERHTQALSCESCHIPKIYSSAVMQVDWTVLQTNGKSKNTCRGTEGPSGSLNALVTGYEPVLLPQTDVDGNVKLAPFNFITTSFWVFGEPPRPVRLADLNNAWLSDGAYRPEILATFDQDRNGALDGQELRIDSAEKEKLIASRLQDIGLENPRIEAEFRPYSINHTVATHDWAISDCKTCHRSESRASLPIQLAAYLPGDVYPEAMSPRNTKLQGKVFQDGTGIYYAPESEEAGYYILGHNSASWIDWTGSTLFLLTLGGVATHAGLRFAGTLRKNRNPEPHQEVYMYEVYERFWHWLQTLVIVSLLFTGLIIHKPDSFGLFSFRHVVTVHNVLAGILLVNAGLSLFYHLASGEIQQFIPRPYGFFDQAAAQAAYYLRGIFKGEAHPFEKTRQKKLNPLQQATYFMILNVLLPLQIITGSLMWGIQRWPELAARLGGLPALAKLHTIVAWLFATFILGHVYLTTTGYRPLSSIKAMMLGWEEVEANGHEGGTPVDDSAGTIAPEGTGSKPTFDEKEFAP